jgi:hypothetical protein
LFIISTLLSGVGVDNGQITEFGLNGNINYELYPELVQGEWAIIPYISGTYDAPPTTKVTLQPINR